MSTRSIPIELPEPIFRRFARIARLTNQPLETLITQSIIGNLPPYIDTSLLDQQAEHVELYNSSTEALVAITVAEIEPAQQQRLSELRARAENVDDELNLEEQREIPILLQNINRFALRKAYAWEILRWRGQRRPSMYELVDLLEPLSRFA